MWISQLICPFPKTFGNLNFRWLGKTCHRKGQIKFYFCSSYQAALFLSLLLFYSCNRGVNDPAFWPDLIEAAIRNEDSKRAGWHRELFAKYKCARCNSLILPTQRQDLSKDIYGAKGGISCCYCKFTFEQTFWGHVRRKLGMQRPPWMPRSLGNNNSWRGLFRSCLRPIPTSRLIMRLCAPLDPWEISQVNCSG